MQQGLDDQNVKGPGVIRLAQSDNVAHILEGNLLKELRARSVQGENTQFTLDCRDAKGDLIGGLIASTSYGWVLIKVLWVAPDHRKMGYGRDLLDAAFSRAKGCGSHSAWLDTSDLAALQFYQRLGFEGFGHLANESDQFPACHQRYFLKKRIG